VNEQDSISTKEKIIGTWSLVQYTMRHEDALEFFHPYGENPLGILIYTLNEVSVHIMNAARSSKDSSQEEKLEMAENYGGYVGHYEIDQDTLVHYPKISGFINFIQTPQIRKFRFSENQLILECDSISKEYGKKVYSQLIWEKFIPLASNKAIS
jgi:hypothetical protein